MARRKTKKAPPISLGRIESWSFDINRQMTMHGPMLTGVLVEGQAFCTSCKTNHAVSVRVEEMWTDKETGELHILTPTGRRILGNVDLGYIKQTETTLEKVIESIQEHVHALSMPDKAYRFH